MKCCLANLDFTNVVTIYKTEFLKFASQKLFGSTEGGYLDLCGNAEQRNYFKQFKVVKIT